MMKTGVSGLNSIMDYFICVFLYLRTIVVAKFFILLNLLNFFMKRLLSDGFNMAGIKKFPHEEP